MSTHDELDAFDTELDEQPDKSPWQPDPALPFTALALCVAGVVIGYYFIWLLGAAMLIASIVCGIIALRRHAPYRWAAIIAITLSAIALIFAAAVISVIVYQVQHAEELLAAM